MLYGFKGRSSTPFRLTIGAPFEFYMIIKEMISSVDFNGKICSPSLVIVSGVVR